VIGPDGVVDLEKDIVEIRAGEGATGGSGEGAAGGEVGTPDPETSSTSGE
jgi:hypothetical protein